MITDLNLSNSIIARASGGLHGKVIVAGDKSISHRALILASLAVGKTDIKGLLEGEDILATAAAMRLFGAEVCRLSAGHWRVYGFGIGGLSEPEDIIDCRNSGTSARLLMGMIASSGIAATFTGDTSLRRRPMRRVIDPLELFGAYSVGRQGSFLPLTLVGTNNAVPINYKTPYASAQIKSAILLAGLNTPGVTVVIEHQKTRDHTERMLKSFGAEVITKTTNAGYEISMVGHPELVGQDLHIGGDPSSAAFPICAALLVKGSEIFLPKIGINATRTGLFKTLQEMGANIIFENKRYSGGELLADLRVCSSSLHGVDVPANRTASMIDEYPILSIVAAFARGRTVFRGVGELRVKESDRIEAMAKGLRAAGVEVETGADYMVIEGKDGKVDGIEMVETYLDHRVSMSFLCMGLATSSPIRIDDGRSIATSFPNFIDVMRNIGADLEQIST